MLVAAVFLCLIGLFLVVKSNFARAQPKRAPALVISRSVVKNARLARQQESIDSFEQAIYDNYTDLTISPERRSLRSNQLEAAKAAVLAKHERENRIYR